MEQYDIVFIGGGPAGYAGALAAAAKGRKSAVIEADKVGGTCLQRGCIPTKALMQSVKALKTARQGNKIGLLVSEAHLDHDLVFKRKDRVVNKLTKGIESLLRKSGVTFIQDRGRITAPGTIATDSGITLKSVHTVIATGSRPLDLPFLARDGKIVLNSDDLLDLSEPPAAMLVIGGGAIGLEWAQILQALGSKVTVVEIAAQLLPGSDHEVAGLLLNELVKQGITVWTATSVSEPEIGPAFSCRLSNGKGQWRESFDAVLLAVGRGPCCTGLWSEGLNIVCDQRGFIKVDNEFRTSLPGVYACGDVTGPPLLAHRATHQALALVNHLFSGRPVPRQIVPAAVFTLPEVASVGLNEQEARELYPEIKTGHFPYAAGSRANTSEEKTGFIKLIADPQERIIGAHIIGAEAAEMLPLLTWAVNRGMAAVEFRDLICIHPSLSENIWEALGSLGGFAIHF